MRSRQSRSPLNARSELPLITYMAPLQRALLGLVVQIFDHGVVTAEQRLALAVLDGQAAITACEREDIFQSFLSMTWGDVIDDEALTTEDWRRLALVVRALRLPMQRVPFPDYVIDLAS
jgi:hypothetical protein